MNETVETIKSIMRVICESCGYEMKDDGSSETTNIFYVCPNCGNVVSIIIE